MSTDLKTRIREYAAGVDRHQEPITVDEIRLRFDRRDETEPIVGLGPSVESRFPERGPWPALVAAVVVLIIFGVFVFVFPGEDPPPADTLPDPMERDLGYYVPSEVPDGFVLQDMDTLGESELLYLREFDDTWLPSDGGFAVYGVHGRPFGLPEDPNGYLDGTLDAVPGSVEIEVRGRRGIFFETEFTQDGLAAPLVWVLGTDDQGGIFEVVAVGMNRGEVLAVAEGIQRVSADDFVSLRSEITWDVRVGAQHSRFSYEAPARVTDLANEVEVVLGEDLLMSRLAHSGQEGTVITTEDGEIVETFGEGIRSTSAVLYLEVPQGTEHEVLRAYPGSADLSPSRRDERVDGYLDQVRGGQILSEIPFVIQAMSGPEPRLDLSQLGEEIPLTTVETVDVVPQQLFTGTFGSEPAAATEERPVIVIGTAGQPDSDTPPVTVLIWFSRTGATCQGTATDGRMGSSGCGFEILRHLGVTGGHTEESSQGVSGEVVYTVPLEASVVQVVTRTGTNYWQQPIGGYGVVPWGDSVDQPARLMAFDADGNEIGSWSVGSR